jgi:hypothetical protein
MLYEVTVDSYRLLYDSGRERLRKEGVESATHEVTLGDKKTRKRPLRQLAFHARDVYPLILRSTLLIRLVAAYEALLTDSLREVGGWSLDFLKSDQRLDLSQEHLLALVEKHGVEQFVLNRTLRSLSSGGFKEIVRFYGKMGIDVAPPGVPLRDLEEIHDRRHLYVHRGGTADEQYCNNYPSSGAVLDVLLPVDELYLLTSIKHLENSAKHIRKQLDARFPQPIWVYTKGLRKLSDAMENVNLFSGEVINGSPLDLGVTLSDGVTTLKNVAIWIGRRGNEFKLLVGGNATQAALYSKHLYLAEINGNLARVVSEKLLR